MDYVKNLVGSFQKKIFDLQRQIDELRTKLINYEREHSFDEMVKFNKDKRLLDKEMEKYGGIIREYGSFDKAMDQLILTEKVQKAIDEYSNQNFIEKLYDNISLVLNEFEERQRKKEQERKTKERAERAKEILSR